MNTRILNWGFLSTANINRAIIPPLRVSSRNRLLAVASRDPDRARKYAEKWGIQRAYGSYQELLDDPDVDVIYNPLPNSLHAEWTIKAAQAGKHVLCEKPLAMSVEEVDAMQAAAEQAGVFVTEAFMYRHHPQTIKVKEMIESGSIGELKLVNGVFTFMLQKPQDVRLDPELGGGSIWDVGCYPISYARYLVGTEPVEVFGWQDNSTRGVDLTFAGQMRFAENVFSQFYSSFQLPFRAYMEIVGSEATISLGTPFKPGENEIIEIRRGDEIQSIASPGQELYIGEVEDMADAVLEGRTPLISLEDSRNTIKTIQALLKSARLGQPIILS